MGSSGRRGAALIIYAVGVLMLILLAGSAIVPVGLDSVEVQARAQYLDQARLASLSGITYGRRHIRQLVRAANADQYPGRNDPPAWQGERWTGDPDAPAAYRATNARPPAVSFLVAVLNHGGTDTAKARVWFRLELDETLARNSYFFGTQDFDSPFVPPPPAPGYEPAQVLYTLTSFGRVDLPDPGDPGNRARDRTIARHSSRLTFMLPVDLRQPGGTDTPTEVTRHFRDQVFQPQEN